MATDSDELLEMRCRSCGMFMGYRRRIGRFVFWCSEDCADTPMAKWEESQVRDEVIVEMYLQGMGVVEIARLLDIDAYQYVQQTLARRSITVDHVASLKLAPTPLERPAKKSAKLPGWWPEKSGKVAVR